MDDCSFIWEKTKTFGFFFALLPELVDLSRIFLAHGGSLSQISVQHKLFRSSSLDSFEFIIAIAIVLTEKKSHL